MSRRFEEIEIDRPLGKILAAKVSALVAEHGGTNLAAAPVLGIGAPVIGKLRAGKVLARYAPETIDALARAAGVTRDALLAGKVAP